MFIFENPFYLLPPLIASAVSLVLVFLVIRGNTRSFVHRLFTLMLAGACAWGIFIFLMRSSPVSEHALVWSRAVNVIIPAVIVMIFHFTFVYTGIKPSRWVIPAIYIFLLVNLALVPSGLLIKDIQIKSYGYAPVVGPAFYPVALIDYLLIILGLVNLFRAWRRADNYEARNRFLYVTIGMAAAFIAGLGDVLPLLGLQLYPGAIFGHIIFYVLTATAMARFHLLDISIVIRKGLAYFIASTLVAVPYVVIIALMINIFNGTPAQMAGYVVLLILLSIALQPLWSRVQSLVDRWFYGSRYRNTRELIMFGQQQFSIKNMSQVADRYTEIARKSMGAREAYLLLPDAGENFIVAGSFPDIETPEEIIFNSSSPVISWFKTHNQPVTLNEFRSIPQIQTLTVSEEQAVNKLGASLFVPLKTQNEELCGILVLAGKISGRPYSDEERAVLLMIASQISVTLDNIRLYQLEKEIRNELQRQNDQKTEFLHTVAHEMKTPLTSLLASSELLEERVSKKDITGSRLVTNIKRSARSMNRRVTELVDSAAVHGGELRIHKEPLDIKAALTEITADLDIMFISRKQRLVLDIEKNLPVLNADWGRLEQIIFNLLSNAVKFSPDNSEIFLKAAGERKSVVFRVLDEAPVISETEKQKLFQPYYRSDDTVRLKEVPGLGMGLYITRKLIEAHNGRIWIEKNGSRGNIFAFSLPVSE